MESYLLTVVIALVVGAVAFVAAWLLAQRVGSKSVAAAKEQAKRIVTEADKEASMKKKEAALEAR